MQLFFLNDLSVIVNFKGLYVFVKICQSALIQVSIFEKRKCQQKRQVFLFKAQYFFLTNINVCIRYILNIIFLITNYYLKILN